MILATVMAAGCTQSSPSPTATTPTATVTTQANTVVTFVDSNGNQVTLPDTAERIVSTNSDCTEMLIAIGVADKIVGVTETVAKTPLLMAQLPANVSNIGNWQSPDIETMMTLKPDVVICYSGSSKPKNIDQILAANLTLVYLDCYKMNTLSHDARALGTITGNTMQADDYAGFIDKYENMVIDNTSKLSAGQKPSVYWESYSDFSTVGNTSGGDTMVSMTGGLNIATYNASLYALTYPKVNSEWVITNNPSYVFKMVSASNVTSADDLKTAQAKVIARPGMSKVNAVTNGSVYAMSGGIAFGPRAVIGMLYAAKALHPDIYESMDPQAVLDEYAQKYLPGSNTGYFIYPIPA
jgi:iron complex transport system substrate-binding protein